MQTNIYISMYLFQWYSIIYFYWMFYDHFSARSLLAKLGRVVFDNQMLLSKHKFLQIHSGIIDCACVERWLSVFSPVIVVDFS